MNGASHSPSYLAEASSDAANRLLSAEEPLAGLQQACGGTIPGPLAVPELLALVVKARRYGLRLSRRFQAVAGAHRINAWIELEPFAGDGLAQTAEGGGCLIRVLTWQTEPRDAEEETQVLLRNREIDRALAELTARLDPAQNIIAFEANGADLRSMERLLADGLGRPWTEFVQFDDKLPSRPLHWRLLDGAMCRLSGSERAWRVQLDPLGMSEPGGDGFALYLTPLTSLAAVADAATEEPPPPATLGSDLVPVLRAPIARIIDNAQTISRKLAGPLADEYSAYAADIAVAGRHLMALMDDLAELEQVEAPDFVPTVRNIDLADIARRAVQVLSVEARARRVRIVPPADGERQFVLADDRRTLQIVLNLLGNAIKYGPEDSQIWLRLDEAGRFGSITVADQGRGLSNEDQARVFDKFERLGRTDAAGTGLGLYISRRIAEAMRGTLTVESASGQGARFTLSLPTSG